MEDESWALGPRAAAAWAERQKNMKAEKAEGVYNSSSILHGMIHQYH